jgi:hypothetical protein
LKRVGTVLDRKVTEVDTSSQLDISMGFRELSNTLQNHLKRSFKDRLSTWTWWDTPQAMTISPKSTLQV